MKTNYNLKIDENALNKVDNLKEEIESLKKDKEELLKLNIELEKKVEKGFREFKFSENRYKRVFENSITPLIIIEDGRFIDCNRSTLNLLKLEDKNQFLGLKPSDISPKTQADGKLSTDKEIEIFKQAYIDGFIHFEWEHKNFNGEPFFVEVSLTCIRLNDKRIFHTSWKDITEQKKTLEKMKQWSEVVKHTNDGVVITDKNNMIISVNEAVESITGYSEKELLTKTPRIFKSNRHEAIFYKKLWDKLLSENQWQGEIWNRRKDGEVYPAWQTINLIYGDDGEIANYVAVFSDMSRLKAQEKNLEYLAHHDVLTNLPNRLLLDARLQHAIQYARRRNLEVAVLFLDLDKFKHINDSLGHQVGDSLLKEVASRIKNCVREIDTVARLGGDEFIVVLEQIKDIDVVKPLAKRILDELLREFKIDGHKLFISVSIGISIFPRDGQSSGELIKHSDSAMYKAKEQGRNNYQFYKEEMTLDAFEKVALERDLREAIENQDFELYYQPKIDITSNRSISAEALIRWHHRELGLVPPDSFIPFAEESGLINVIGDWVFKEACLQIKKWKEENLKIERISINVSGVQLKQGDFLDKIKNVLNETKCKPEWVEIEITETFIAHHLKDSVILFDSLKDLGIKISIDDFGTGYSSLSYLKQLPIDKLKIDKSFIMDILTDFNDRAIIEAIITLAKSLNLEIVAEGVESIEQSDFLKSIGCNIAQGFLYSKPIEASEFKREFLKE